MELVDQFIVSLVLVSFIIHSVSMNERTSPFVPLDTTTLNRLIVLNQHGQQNHRYNFLIVDDQPPSDNISVDHLSTSGRRQMYSLGQALRSRYGSFLTYNPLDFRAQSSDSDVSIESSLLILNGVVKATGEWIYDDSTDFIPIPVHTGSKKLDCVLDSDCNCPYAEQWSQSIENHPTMRTIKSNYTETIGYLVGKVNLTNMNSLINLTLLYEDLEYARNHDQPLPKFITPSVYRNLSRIAAQVESFEACSSEIISIRVTRLFDSISTLIKEVSSSNDASPQPRFHLYSSSGLLMSAVRCALAISDSSSSIDTPDGSVLMMEIHQIEDQHFIQLYYWDGDYTREPNLLTPTFCYHNLTVGVCSIKETLDRLDEYILPNWPEKCGLCPDGYRANEIMAIILCIIILTVLLVTCLAVLRRRKNRYEYEEIEE